MSSSLDILTNKKFSTSISWCLCDNFIWFSLDSISMNIFQCCQASASEAEAKEDGNSRDENAKASARSTVYFLYLKIFLSSLLFNKWKIGGHQKHRCRVASGASTVKPSQHRVQRDSEIGWSCQRVRLSNEFGASIQTESWDYFPTTWFQCFSYAFTGCMDCQKLTQTSIAWMSCKCLLRLEASSLWFVFFHAGLSKKDKHGDNVKDCLDWKYILAPGLQTNHIVHCWDGQSAEIANKKFHTPAKMPKTRVSFPESIYSKLYPVI